MSSPSSVFRFLGVLRSSLVFICFTFRLLFLPWNFNRLQQRLPAVPTYPPTVPIAACDGVRTLYPPIATATSRASPRITIRFGRQLLQGFRWLRVGHCFGGSGGGGVGRNRLISAWSGHPGGFANPSPSHASHGTVFQNCHHLRCGLGIRPVPGDRALTPHF